ncbi:unnamed protein product [Adineta steineri]|uniref:Uncharacterized protein n=1 Tax=Adineta steineri TaxID=433720 RepID=A0A815FX56_9BILA|nr:unnamed protein product [Adineta steineri]CAF1589484.1 unnamed protein product [Adineta steineri]
MKPIFIAFTDGRSNVKSRFSKARQCCSDLFIQNSFDALFVTTNPPDHSAYNPIDRRMASLNHDLSGLILPHDYWRNHLNESGKTIDIGSKNRHFRCAGTRLAEV